MSSQTKRGLLGILAIASATAMTVGSLMAVLSGGSRDWSFVAFCGLVTYAGMVAGRNFGEGE